jgi:hypothetical protein
MYINVVADSVILYLQHDFYNIIFKIKHKLYIATESALTSLPPPQGKILGAHVDSTVAFRFLEDVIFVMTTSCRPALPPTHPLIQWEEGIFLEIRRPGPESDRSSAARNQG